MQLQGITDRGQERQRNEDNFFAASTSETALLVVADGMGGHQAGDVASSLAVQAAERYWAGLEAGALALPGKARLVLEQFMREANDLIYREAAKSSKQRGMGTTLTAALLCGPRLTIGHIGDSRAYLVREGRITLLTRDHSLVEELVDSGQVSPEEARSHPQRHILTRALGTDPQPLIDFMEWDLPPGSLILLCTDGLTGLLNDEEILAACAVHKDARRLVEALVALANERGGIDNITVVVAGEIGGRLS